MNGMHNVSHSILLESLHSLGVTGSALAWVASFLNERTFQVFSTIAESAICSSAYGVPQGSILSPLLFNIYIRPLATIVEDAGLSIYSYADDTQIVFSLSDSRSQDTSALKIGLSRVAAWMQVNLLKLNGEKTEVIILGKHKDLWGSRHWPSNMGPLPTPVPVVRNLGFLIDEKLSMRQQATKVAAICFNTLRWLQKILWMLPESTRRTVVQALVMSRIDYGNVLYLGADKATMNVLQVVQNSAARLLCNVPRRMSATQALCDLHWLKIADRVAFKTLCLMFKIHQGSAPAYLHNLVRPYQPNRSLRSSNQENFVIPRIRLTKMGGRSFAHLGPKMWNALPLTLKTETNLLAFRKKLKTFLF